MQVQNIVIVANYAICRKLCKCYRRYIFATANAVAVRVTFYSVGQEDGVGVAEGTLNLHTGLIDRHMRAAAFVTYRNGFHIAGAEREMLAADTDIVYATRHADTSFGLDITSD